MDTHCKDCVGHAADASAMHYYGYGTRGQGELDSLLQLNSDANANANASSYNYSSGSGCSCSSYMGSPSSSSSSSLQRSVSSHSLHHHHHHHHRPFSALFAELLHSPVRRVCSTGDLQRIHGMQHYLLSQSDTPLSSESSIIIQGMSRAIPYSPAEKKLRIERYRSKRNRRNFCKKIKYACRKTLADSRPRIRGRFARNDEVVMNQPVQWSPLGAGEEEDEEDENWDNFFDSLVPDNLARDPQGTSSFGVFY